MHIEDIILRLERSPVGWMTYDDIKVVTSMARSLQSGHALTEKQGKYIVSILNKYTHPLIRTGIVGDEQCLENPSFRLGFRAIVAERHIAFSGDGKHFSVTFPYDAELINIIREYRQRNSKSGGIFWSAPEWRVYASEENLVFIIQELLPHGFTLSEELSQIVERASGIIQNFEQYTPHLDYDNGRYCIRNPIVGMPEIKSTTCLGAALEAHALGVGTWSDTVDALLANETISRISRRILTGAKFVTMENDETLDDLGEALRYFPSSLVIVPVGAEQSYIEEFVGVANSQGISNDQMSVLFRLSNKTNTEFNQYIRQAKLNNPLSEQSRIVFIRDIVPRKIVEQQPVFEMIVSPTRSPSNNALRHYLHTHHLIVNVQGRKQKEPFDEKM